MTTITSFKLSYLLYRYKIVYGLLNVNGLGYNTTTRKCVVDQSQNLIPPYSLEKITEYLFHKYGIKIDLDTFSVTKYQNNNIIGNIDVPLDNIPNNKLRLLDDIIFSIFKNKLYEKNL